MGWMEQLAALAEKAADSRYSNELIVLPRNNVDAILALGRENAALREAAEGVIAWCYRIEGKVPGEHTALGRLAAALEGGKP